MWVPSSCCPWQRFPPTPEPQHRGTLTQHLGTQGHPRQLGVSRWSASCSDRPYERHIQDRKAKPNICMNHITCDYLSTCVREWLTTRVAYTCSCTQLFTNDVIILEVCTCLPRLAATCAAVHRVLILS